MMLESWVKSITG